MKTFKYGGRKTPPTKDELSQLVVRNTTFNLLSHSKPVQFVQLYCALFPLRQDVFSLSNYTVMRISNFLQEKLRKKKVFKQVFMFLFFFFFFKLKFYYVSSYSKGAKRNGKFSFSLDVVEC